MCAYRAALRMSGSRITRVVNRVSGAGLTAVAFGRISTGVPDREVVGVEGLIGSLQPVLAQQPRHTLDFARRLILAGAFVHEIVGGYV